jgi:septal ring factor EnvC (AmiA/AmiB activator)
MWRDSTTADEKLAALENTQREQLAQLQTARSERGVVLQSFRSEARSRAASLDRLKQQQSLLEKLLRELRRAAQRFPVEGRGPFATLKGQLAWPVEGRTLARFGERRAGALRWEGMLLAAERGAPVRAIYHGRVLYADWLAGLGLLVIVDHGDGYLSLYGHNDQLYRKVGERVTAGDILAAAGDSGGRERPQLYFEIRRSGRPLDPQPWFRSR